MMTTALARKKPDSAADPEADIPSWTLTRLRSLKRGERVVYYRGNLDFDLHRSPPLYAALLDRIRSAAYILSVEGKIELHVVEYKTGDKTLKAFEYSAVGI